MAIHTTRSHVIRPGEILTTISRRYGPGWKALYYQEADAKSVAGARRDAAAPVAAR